MNDKAKLVPLTLVEKWWGLTAEAVRGWAEQDGASLRPSSWGAAIGRRELREALTRRGLSVPAGLESWPRVLVAADEMDVLKPVFEMLEEAYADAEVLLSHDRDHALRSLESFRPHLLVADLRSPRFDAAEVCRQARFTPTTPSTKVLALGAAEPTRLLLERAGAACLPAQAKAEELAAAAARLLDHERPAPEELVAPAGPLGLARLFAWR